MVDQCLYNFHDLLHGVTLWFNPNTPKIQTVHQSGTHSLLSFSTCVGQAFVPWRTPWLPCHSQGILPLDPPGFSRKSVYSFWGKSEKARKEWQGEIAKGSLLPTPAKVTQMESFVKCLIILQTLMIQYLTYVVPFCFTPLLLTLPERATERKK